MIFVPGMSLPGHITKGRSNLCLVTVGTDSRSKKEGERERERRSNSMGWGWERSCLFWQSNKGVRKTKSCVAVEARKHGEKILWLCSSFPQELLLLMPVSEWAASLP